MGVNILGTGVYTPSITVTNEMMSKIVETSDEWITTRTGISSRNMSNGEPTWYMGAEAAKAAIAEAGIDSKDIGLIIDATITADFHTPSTACIIQREIGAVGAACVDVNAACSGFIYGFDMAMRYLMTDDTLKYALVVANENLSKITNFEDRTTCVLFGDGAAAVVIEKSDKLYTSWLSADGTGAQYLYCKGDPAANAFMGEDKLSVPDGTDENITHHYLVQDGKEVYKFATKALPTAATKAAEKIGLDITEVDYFVPHQANVRILETAAKNLGVSMDKFIVTLDHHGNTSSASVPIALDEAIKSGKIKRGDKLCLVGFGAGLTLGAAIIEY
ncbi:MAG: ketoacyl-ACP synthase III [Oscillospiraceae bacterium]|nr:ketoacyl-ACP synthase III [Oscillospiraceae bacterium]